MISAQTRLIKAERINRDMDLVIRAGIVNARQAMQAISRDALSIFLENDSVNIPSQFAELLTISISKTMAMANLLGQRRSLLDVGLSVSDLVEWGPIHSLQLDRFSEIRRQLERKGLLQELDRQQKGYARQIYSDLYQIGSKVDAKIRFAVSQVVAKKLPKRKAIAAIKQALAKIGYDVNNPYQIKTLYETAVTRAYGKGRWDRDHTPQVWNLFWGYEYVTMRDDRVRPAHRAIDGTTLPKNNEFWLTYWPPNGWNCRCVVVKVMKRRKIWQPKNPPPPDKGFEHKGLTFGDLGLSNFVNRVNGAIDMGLYNSEGCCIS